MSQVSKYPVTKDVAQRMNDVFLKTFISLKGQVEVASFADDLFTNTEKIMLAKRISIAVLLLKDYDYRKISRILNVSSATINSVNEALLHGKGSLKKVIERIMRDEKFEKFFLDTVEKIFSIPAKSSKGGGVYRYLKQEIKNSSNKNKPF